VRVEAFVDPTPGELTTADDGASLNEQFAELIRQTQDVPEQELMDQVYRRLTLHLCGRCYGEWIENPAGSPNR
jgi:hypothetical protein